jgi:hypothetical protein
MSAGLRREHRARRSVARLDRRLAIYRGPAPGLVPGKPGGTHWGRYSAVQTAKHPGAALRSVTPPGKPPGSQKFGVASDAFGSDSGQYRGTSVLGCTGEEPEIRATGAGIRCSPELGEQNLGRCRARR